MSRWAKVFLWLYVVATLSLTVTGVWLTLNRQGGQSAPCPVGSPGPWPSHGPACVDLAWLDGRWVCIPQEEAG